MTIMWIALKERIKQKNTISEQLLIDDNWGAWTLEEIEQFLGQNLGIWAVNTEHAPVSLAFIGK